MFHKKKSMRTNLKIISVDDTEDGHATNRRIFQEGLHYFGANHLAECETR